MCDNDPDQRIVKLLSSDGNILEISRKGSRQSATLNDLIVASGFDDKKGMVDPIQVNNITAEVLTKVICFCEHYKNDEILDGEASSERDITSYDVQFMNVDKFMVHKLILAAVHLKIESLLDVSTTTFAGMLKGKTTEEMRIFLEIENDFTPEEEEELRMEREALDD